MKYLLSSLIFVLILILQVPSVLALTIDQIGTSSPTTITFTQWYYTSQNPVLSGTTGNGGVVAITIDNVENTVVADASGNWRYQPTTLTTGDHSVVIADATQQASFTLTIGSAGPTGSSDASGSSLPVAGSLSTTLMILGMGGTLVFGGLKLSHKI